MFDRKKFIKDNIILGFKRGIFTKPYVMTLCIDWLSRGILTDADLAEIDETCVETMAEGMTTDDE